MSTNLQVGGIEVPREDEDALIEAYRKDVRENGPLSLLAWELGVTINLYRPDSCAGYLGNPIRADEIQKLGMSERFLLTSPSPETLGKGIPIINLFYNKYRKCYEILEGEEGQFCRRGTSGKGEDSLYHCIVKVMEPLVTGDKYAQRVSYYKNHVTKAVESASDDYVRQRLQENIIPGSNVERELQRISNDRDKIVLNLKKLVGNLRDELDAVDPPKVDESKYSEKYRDTRQLLAELEYDFDRKASALTHDQLMEKYDKIQQQRLKILKEGYKSPKKWQATDVYIRLLVQNSDDYRALALAAVLDDQTIDINERFRVASNFLATTEPNNLKRCYMRLVGAANMDRLERDLEIQFYVEGDANFPVQDLGGFYKYFTEGLGHKLQFSYLLSLLETGEPSAAAKLAVKLGLLYRGREVTKLTREQKVDITKLVEENPGELASLADVTSAGKLVDTSDDFLRGVFDRLQQAHHGFLLELQGKLRHVISTDPITGVSVDTFENISTSDSAAKALLRVMYDFTVHEKRGLDFSLEDRIIEWMKGCSQTELEDFIKAGESGVVEYTDGYDYPMYKRFVDGSESRTATGDATVNQRLWVGIKICMAGQFGNWKRYLLDMANAQVIAKNEEGKLMPERSEPLRPLKEVEAYLKYKKSKGLVVGYKQRKETLAKVLNMLSATDEWDPKAKLVQLIQEHPRLKRHEKYEQYEQDPTLWLNDLLSDAYVDAEGKEQVNLLLYAGGSYNGEEATDPERNIDNYLSLKRKAHRTYVDALLHGLSTENIITAVGKVKPGSIEHWMMRKDKKLLTQIRKHLRSKYRFDPLNTRRMHTAWSAISQALDLDSEWEDLDITSLEKDEIVFPEPPSVTELEEFEAKYKDSDMKKKLIAGKFALTYSLAKDQSVFHMSDRRELLKVVFAAQLEGYQGDELMTLLDEIDPNIRHSLERDPGFAWTQHEKSAHAQLKKFLIEGQNIEFKDFLAVAKGLFNNDYSVIDFAVNDISAEKAVALWCQGSYAELQEWSAVRLQKTLKLYGITAREGASGTSSAEVNQLREEIQDLDEKISQHEFRVDVELKSQLEGLVKEDKLVEFERQLKQNIGEKLLSAPDDFDDIYLSPYDLALKGCTLLAEANIKYHNLLRTGVGYHKFTVSGLESTEEMNNFMHILWKTTCVEPTGSMNDREEEERHRINQLKEAHEALITSLDKWKGMQDKYTKMVVNAVNQTVSVVFYTAMAASGIGAVAFVALGPVTTAINSLVTKYIEGKLSRKGEIPTREILRVALAGAVAAIPSVLATVDYGAVPGLQKIINDSIASALTKGQITSFSKAIAEGISKFLTAKGTGDFELSSKAFTDKVVEKLQDYNLTQAQVYKTALEGISAGATKYAADAIKAGITDMDSEAFKKLDPETKSELTAQYKPVEIFYKNVHNTLMASKGYELLSTGASNLANLPFVRDVEIEGEEKEEEQKNLDISSSVVDALARKGLRVDADFDYSDAGKLTEQVASKMPGVGLTQDEIEGLKSEVDSEFAEKQQTLTEEDRELPVEDQKAILLDREKDQLSKERMEPWKQELDSMRVKFESEWEEVRKVAEAKVEEEMKEKKNDIEAVQAGNEISNDLLETRDTDRVREEASPGDATVDVVGQGLAARLVREKSPKNKEEKSKKKAAKKRRHRLKKKVALESS